jgi:4-amino-4-deoxy-L-arabinose transferase-like glycosyltransferase
MRLFAVMVIAAVTRVVYFLAFAAGAERPLSIGGGDGFEYWALGEHLTHGLSFDSTAFIYRPPGYPLLIAGELLATPGSNTWVPIVVNMVLSVAVVPLTYLLATSLGLSTRCGLIAALIIAVEPTTALWAVAPVPEPLETLFYVGAMILAATAIRDPSHALRYGALCGVATAAALLVKPAAIGLAVVLAVILAVGLRRRLGLRAIAPAALVIAIVLVPYVAWSDSNRRNFGVATYSSLGNYQLYFIRGASVLRRVSGKPPGAIEQELADRLSRKLGATPSPSRGLYYYRATTDKRAIDEMGSLARTIFTDHPGWFLAMYPISAAKLFFSPGYGFPSFAYAVIEAVLYLMALVGLVALWRARNRLALWMIVAVVGYLTILTTTGHGSPNTRYLVPAMPLIAIAAATAVAPARRSVP